MRHQQLAAGRWNDLSFLQQLANIGSEVSRAVNWKNKGNEAYTQEALERALELFDLTVVDNKNKDRLKEVLRAREMVVDYFGDNSYQSTAEQWQKYFLTFNFAANSRKL